MNLIALRLSRKPIALILINGRAPMPELAQELIDAIIDHVAADTIEDDPLSAANMLQVSLVNRSFRPRSLQHIYTSIGIRGDTRQARKTRARQLLDIIKEHPQIARYIRDIWLESIDFETQTNPLLEDERIILDVVERISPLRSLTLSSTYVEHPVGPLLLKNLILPFISPSITCLNLVEIENIPLEVITSCANLTSLNLTMVRLMKNSQSRIAPALRLKHLSYRSSSIAMRQLLHRKSCLDLSQLKSFSVFTDDPQYSLYNNQVLSIVALSNDSLEELRFSDPMGGTKPWIHLDLQCLDRLRSLHVSATFYSQALPSVSGSLTAQTPSLAMQSILGPLLTVRARSLESLSIEVVVMSLSSDMLRNTQRLELLLSAGWTKFCSPIARIMTGMGSTFEFKLTCRMSISIHDAPIETEVRRQLQQMCHAFVNKLNRDDFRTLKEDHKINCTSPNQAQIFINRL